MDSHPLKICHLILVMKTRIIMLSRRRESCMNDGYEETSCPKIGSVVTIFSVEPSHPTFAKQGKTIGAAPQSAVISNHIYTSDAHCKEDDDNVSAEEELCDFQTNPRQQTLFFSNNPNTEKLMFSTAILMQNTFHMYQRLTS